MHVRVHQRFFRSRSRSPRPIRRAGTIRQITNDHARGRRQRSATSALWRTRKDSVSLRVLAHVRATEVDLPFSRAELLPLEIPGGATPCCARVNSAGVAGFASALRTITWALTVAGSTPTCVPTAPCCHCPSRQRHFDARILTRAPRNLNAR